MPDNKVPFFDAAMRLLNVGTTKEEFATNYANAGNNEKNSSIWQTYYEQGEKEFETLDFDKSGSIDQNEFNSVSYYVSRLNGYRYSGTIPDEPQNEQDVRYKESESGDTVEQIDEARDNLPEIYHLKPLSTMTKAEILDELKKYHSEGLADSPQESLTIEALRKQLDEIRRNRNKLDSNSDRIDYHIGTFNQGKHGVCVMLSQLNGLNDETLRRMVTEKMYPNGEKYYEITFPCDSNKPDSYPYKKIKIDEKDLKRGTIVINGVPMTDFSEGDLDVRLIEMAFLKRFGTDVDSIGMDTHTGHDIFAYTGEESKLIGTDYEITEEKIKDAIAKKEHITLMVKHSSRLPEGFSYQTPLTSSSGITGSWTFVDGDRGAAECLLQSAFMKKGLEFDRAKFKAMSDNEFMDATYRYLGNDYFFTASIVLSNGNTMMENHAYTLKGYDEKTKQLILANPHNSNEDIYIPLEIAQTCLDM